MSKTFVLDSIPKFSDAKVTLGKETYELHMIGERGGVITVSEKGVPIDNISLTRNGMKGLFMLLTKGK